MAVNLEEISAGAGIARASARAGGGVAPADATRCGRELGALGLDACTEPKPAFVAL